MAAPNTSTPNLEVQGSTRSNVLRINVLLATHPLKGGVGRIFIQQQMGHPPTSTPRLPLDRSRTGYAAGLSPRRKVRLPPLARSAWSIARPLIGVPFHVTDWM